ncbi:glycosyltransferase [Oceanobacillus sp. 143]|nr:glycosyltransferase [Oceanobacillus sp. 143]
MFSRRVFEGLACGTPIVSSYSTGIKKTFSDIVVISENEQQLKTRINNLMTDDKSYRELAMRGIREIYRHHTYLHRLEYILGKMKIRYQPIDRDVTAMFSINNMAEFHKALDILEQQSYQNIKAVLIISLFEGYESLLNNYNNDNVRTYLRDYAAKYKDVSELIETNYVAVMNLEDEYGTYYLEDLVHASTYSGGDIIGKKSVSTGSNYHYAPFEYEFVDSIMKGTGLYKRDILKKVPLERILFNEEELIESLFKEHGANIYSSDQFSIKLNWEDES